jgi:plasmid stabilization system protein ParE
VQYAIYIYPRAMADISAAVNWRAQRSAMAAGQVHTGLLRSIRTLANNPERCVEADEAADLGIPLREFHYGRRRNIWRILFTIDGQTVNVLRVRHAAQDRLASDDI